MRIAVIGDEGAGKTTAMTAFGSLASDLYNAPIGANYPLYGQKRFTLIDTKEKLYSFEKGILLFDEMWLSMDSRTPRDNIEMSKWVRQTRKKHILMFYTTQSLDQIDKRVKQSTALIMYCRKRKGYILFSFCDAVSGQVKRTFKITDPTMFFQMFDTDALVDVLGGW